MSTRIFAVSPRASDEQKPVATRLVRAEDLRQARRHVLDTMEISEAPGELIHELAVAGVQIEDGSKA